MINFIWSLLEVIVWSFWQLLIVLFALGIHRGYTKGEDDATKSSDD